METKNRWEDTGRDCPNCGGEILQRTDQLPDGTISVYNQCRSCEAQWSSEWEPVRDGRDEVISRRKGRLRRSSARSVPRWVWITLGAMAVFILLRTGGIGLARILLVPLGLALLAWLVFRLGQDQGWWSF